MYRHIYVPVDNSEHSNAAIDVAVALGKAFGDSAGKRFADQDNGEIGGKMSLSSWYYLRLEPSPSIARWLYPPLVAIAVLGFELWGFSWARRWLRG